MTVKFHSFKPFQALLYLLYGFYNCIVHPSVACGNVVAEHAKIQSNGKKLLHTK
jgi:hypothetical protein